jgi:HAD superfamily hydrolase (TIGR01458 family)
MHAILLDLDGVFYVGERAIDSAGHVLRWLEDTGIEHLFVTNTTSKPIASIVAKLAAMGLEVAPEKIVSPPVIARQWLHEKKFTHVALFTREATKTEFESFHFIDEGEEQVDAVIVGDMGERWDFWSLNRAFRLLMRAPKPQLVALGLTRYWRAPDGLRLDTGAFVAALQYATGIEPVVLGKPARAFFRTALQRLNALPQETIMIGDDIKGDIEGAQHAGIQGVLVRTGKFAPADLASGITPLAVIDSIVDLPRWWETQSP